MSESAIWVLRVRSGAVKGTYVSFDAPPSKAYMKYLPAAAYDALKAENARLHKINPDVIDLKRECDAYAIAAQAEAAQVNLLTRERDEAMACVTILQEQAWSALSRTLGLRKQLAVAREALVEVANKDGFTILNESEERMSGSAQAFCDVATIAIEALAALDSAQGDG